MNIFNKDFVKDEKRALIIKTAGRLFCSSGYGNVNIEEIGRELNLAKTIIYYYFKNKADLFRCCHELATDLLEDAYNSSAHEEPLEHLREFILRYVASLIGEDSPGAVLLDVELLPESDYHPIVTRREAVYKKLRQLLEQLKESHEIRNVDTKLAILTMMGSINIIPKWYSSNGQWSPELIASYQADLFISWLKAK